MCIQKEDKFCFQACTMRCELLFIALLILIENNLVVLYEVSLLCLHALPALHTFRLVCTY